MKRERALKIVLVVVGVLFCAALYPLVLMVKQDPALAMMMSLYTTLGVFLLLASRNPSAHCSLIAFACGDSPPSQSPTRGDVGRIEIGSPIMLPSGPQLLFDVRELFADGHDSVTPLSELRHRCNSSLRLGLSVLPTMPKESTYGKSQGHNYWRNLCRGCDHRHYDLNHSFLL